MTLVEKTYIEKLVERELATVNAKKQALLAVKIKSSQEWPRRLVWHYCRKYLPNTATEENVKNIPEKEFEKIFKDAKTWALKKGWLGTSVGLIMETVLLILNFKNPGPNFFITIVVALIITLLSTLPAIIGWTDYFDWYDY